MTAPAKFPMVADQRPLGGVMQRILLPWLVSMQGPMDALADMPDDNSPRMNVWFTLYGAREQVQLLATGCVYSPYLRSSYALATELLGYLNTELSLDLTANPNITQLALWQIKETWKRYKIALLADFGALESYFVVQQGGFDIRTLTEAGELLFPADMTTKVPETLFDAREAGKCIAYAVPTSAGFHIFRVLESVLRKYYSVVTGGAATPKVRNIGVYLNALKQAKKGDPIVLAALKQIADLHRNPLIHPEAVLTMDEALSALGICRSVTSAMLAKMPVPPLTTSTSAIPVA